MKSKIINGIIYAIEQNGLFTARYCLGGAYLFKYGSMAIPENLLSIYKELLWIFQLLTGEEKWKIRIDLLSN